MSTPITAIKKESPITSTSSITELMASISTKLKTLTPPPSPPPSRPKTTKHPEHNTTNDTNTNNNTNINDHDDDNNLAPFNPTNTRAQHLSLELLSLQHDDVLFDLGCGDARILIAAAARTPGLRCVGVEMDPRYYRRAVDAVTTESREDGDGIGNRIYIHLGDVLSINIDDDDDKDESRGAQQSDNPNTNAENQGKQQPLPQQVVETMESGDDQENNRNATSKTPTPLSRLSLLEDATCVFLYLLPEGLEKVKPLLEQCMVKNKTATTTTTTTRNHLENEEEEDNGRGGQNNRFRVVSYMFRIPNWKPVGMREHADGCCKIYLYDVTSISKEEGDSLFLAEDLYGV